MAYSGREMENIIREFRVSELQALLAYAGRNKVGKKSDLQNRALDLLRLHSSAIDMKITELYQKQLEQGGRKMRRRNSDDVCEEPLTVEPVKNVLTAHIPRPPVNVHLQFPVNPDVKFRPLPFYDQLAVLLRPTSLVTQPQDRLQLKEISFCFSPQHLENIHNIDVSVLLRICLLDTSCEQEDELPTSICLKVNKTLCKLPQPVPLNRPGVEPKRPKNPVDITALIKKTAHETNEVSISWASNSVKPYVLGIYLVQKQTADALLNKLKCNGIRNPDHTTAMIKEKLHQDHDSEIATMSLRASLLCPLGKIRMKYPCRARTCTHLQCFDGNLYLQMNEKKSKWVCPVCDSTALFKDLTIDGLFLDIIGKVPSNCTEVQFHQDGSWTPVLVTKKPELEAMTIDTPPKIRCYEIA